jgi:hypothetical protein
MNAHFFLKQLTRLHGEFEDGTRDHAGLNHLLIETATPRAFEDASGLVKRAFFEPWLPHYDQPWEIVVQLVFRGTAEIQLFIERDSRRGRTAFDRLRGLARRTLDVLIDFGVFELELLYPQAADAGPYDYQAAWMWFVHKMAQNPRTGDELVSRQLPCVGGQFFKFKGEAAAFELDPRGVFQASALVIQRLLEPFRTKQEELQPDGTWMTAKAAHRWADESGIKVSLQTMGRAKKKGQFKWRPGGADCSYEVEQESFDTWVRGWWRQQLARKKGHRA